MSLKQIFCFHVFKEISQEILYSARKAYGTKWGVTAYQNFIYAASHRQCLKCKKEIVVKLRALDI